MKKLRIRTVFPLFLLMSGGITVYGQNSQKEVPGDDFSLEGALELFKKSVSPEDFEQRLNSADSKVNNLDLNGDGEIDYIKVIDRNEDHLHAFILQAVISETESQDVAVIELEKQADGKAVLQITGDADVYGIETIIEPTEEVRVNAGTSTARNIVNVWTWPSVQFIYSPYYTVWNSPWRWSLRPIWWSPWRPVGYYAYASWWNPYRPYYSQCHTHRIGYAPQFYRPFRTTSVIVYNNHYSQIAHYRSNHNYNHNGRNGYDHGRSNQDYHNNRNSRSDMNGRRTSPSYENGNANERGHQRQQDFTGTPFVRRNSNSRMSSSPEFRSVPELSQRNANGQHSPGISHRQITRPAEMNNIQRPQIFQREQRGSSGHLASPPSGSNGERNRTGGHQMRRH